MKKYLLLILLFFVVHITFSQITAQELSQRILAKEIAAQSHLNNPQGSSPGLRMPAAPEQDCSNAIPLCQVTYNQLNSYSGNGSIQEIPTNSSCLGANEFNSVWYIFTVQSNGTLDFEITPSIGGDDYDFALYDITGLNCSAISSGVISSVRCNFSANPGNTGLSAGGINASESAGGSNQSSTLNVTSGQTYVLLINNSSSSAGGYSINISNGGGAATITDNVVPDVVSVYAACGASSLVLTTSESVTCSSITALGSEFSVTGTGGPYIVTAGAGINCGTSSNQIAVTISPALSGTGPWTLIIGNGSDGDVLLDNCGNQMLPTNINFTSSAGGASISGMSQICSGAIAGLTASIGSSWSWSGPGAFSSTNQTISVSPAVTSTYTVTVSNGTCPPSIAQQTIVVIPGTLASAGPDDTICAGQPSPFAASGGSSYSWLPTTGLDNPLSPTPIATPTVTTTYILTATNGGLCPSTDMLTVYVNPIPTIDAGPDQLINVGDNTVLDGSGSGALFWTSPGITLGCNECQHPIVNPFIDTYYYLTVTGINGCTASDHVLIAVTPFYAIYIPNAFTPNSGDYNNETFMAKGYGLETLTMKIFDRWGKLLFETSETNKGWDGTYGGAFVDEGVYVFSITAQTLRGDAVTKRGHVVVLK